MVFSEHATEFMGKEVYDFAVGDSLRDPATSVPALRATWEHEDVSGVDLIRAMLQDPNADQLTGVVIGAWITEIVEDPPVEMVEALLAAAEQLPSLRGLFFGDIIYEECEVSWLEMTDLSPLIQAFPKLEHMQVRGSQSLELGVIESLNLKTLIAESGGMPRTILADLWKSKLPELTHLEIYLGDSGYGWDGSIADLEPLLSGELFPKLTHLGLRDSEIADQIAEAVAQAPLLERLEVLDLSLGTLGDRGVKALLTAPAFAKLKKFDMHHHYVSEEVLKQLTALGIEINAEDAQGDADEDDRYVSIGE